MAGSKGVALQRSISPKLNESKIRFTYRILHEVADQEVVWRGTSIGHGSDTCNCCRLLVGLDVG